MCSAAASGRWASSSRHSATASSRPSRRIPPMRARPRLSATVTGVSAAQATTADNGMRVERGPKRVRAYLGGTAVADTVRPLLVWEIPYYPTYYFPAADVRADLLHADDEGDRGAADGEQLTVRVGEREARGAATRFGDAAPSEQLQNTVRLEWSAMDAWFEEDEEVFTHARDPHRRIDILASSRHVRVEVAGETVAESTSPRLLFETGLPVRYYLPKPDVRLTCPSPAGPSPTSRTRAPPKPSRYAPADRCTGTSPGPIRPPWPRARRSPG